jgi:hypothetical protein
MTLLCVVLVLIEGLAAKGEDQKRKPFSDEVLLAGEVGENWRR